MILMCVGVDVKLVMPFTIRYSVLSVRAMIMARAEVKVGTVLGVDKAAGAAIVTSPVNLIALIRLGGQAMPVILEGRGSQKVLLLHLFPSSHCHRYQINQMQT